MIYMGFEAFKRKHNLSFGHEASLVTLVGFCLSLAWFQAEALEFNKMMEFNDNLFFYICLPPIVFASGFNMQRKKILANIKNIMLFGLLGTLICFASFSILIYVYINLINGGSLTQVDG